MFNTLVEMFDSIVAKSPNAVAQMGKTAKGAFIPKTYKELQKEVRAVALALLELGVTRGDNIGIISDNRPEWLASDLAILALGGSDVPRGRDAMPYEVEHILSVTEAKLTFAENDEQKEKILGISSNLPSLRTIVVFDGEEEERGVCRG